MTGAAHKAHGFVATPEPIASELIRWSVRSPRDRVLDLGAGEGVFLVQAAHRLQALGADAQTLASALYGVEKDDTRYQTTVNDLRSRFGTSFGGLRHADLFECEFPTVSVIVGNPPYIRRSGLSEIERIHQRIIHHDLLIGDIPRLADLYTYFLVYAERFLESGGRLAVVVSSSWLDTRSGEFLKRFLRTRFTIHSVVSSSSRLFRDALVKSVLLTATKAEPATDHRVRFVHLEDFQPGVLSEIDGPRGGPGLQCYEVAQRSLRDSEPWSLFLRTPEAYDVARKAMREPLGTYVESRIGIQPLARDFFVLPLSKARDLGLPEQLLAPIAYSPRHVSGAVVEARDQCLHRILYVRQARGDIADASVRRYIEAAEKTDVRIRGKDIVVRGFHRVPRLQLAGRQPWYNMADEIDRRGRYPILLPRRFYDRLVVVWNKALVVGGENFIELRPRAAGDLLVLLAILNSSFFEMVARSHAQQYGGGVYNLNPLDVRDLPIFTLPQEPSVRQRLESAFIDFAGDPTDRGRGLLDAQVAEVFGVASSKLAVVARAVARLRAIGKAAKRLSA